MSLKADFTPVPRPRPRHAVLLPSGRSPLLSPQAAEAAAAPEGVVLVGSTGFSILPFSEFWASLAERGLLNKSYNSVKKAGPTACCAEPACYCFVARAHL